MGDAMKSRRLTWYLQRCSAIYFVSFLVYLEYIFWTSGITFQFLNSNNLFKALLSIFILLASVHAYIGLWTVGTDYLTKRTNRGWLEFRSILDGSYIITAIHEFVPRLPWLVYKFTQAKAHLLVMKRFENYLNTLKK